MKVIKDIIRSLLILLHIDATKNLKYDRLTKTIIKMSLQPDSNTIDVGCHKGEILDMFKIYAPKGTHFAFEPIPKMFEDLKKKYPNDVVFPYALSKEPGELTFNHVLSDPAYSGLQKRKYKTENPEINQFQVAVETLNRIIPKDTKIDFIKIDVEGGEYDVLLGSQDLLKHSKPSILFEFGLGASDFYKTKPEDLYTLFSSHNYSIYILQDFVNGAKPMSISQFKEVYESNDEYYFFAK